MSKRKEYSRIEANIQLPAYRLPSIFGAFSLIAVAIVVIGGCTSKSRGSSKVETEPASALTWSTGQSYTYNLRLVSRAEVASAGNAFDLDLSADVELTPVSVSSEIVELYLALRNPKLHAGTEAAKSKAQDLVGELQAPYFFTLEKGRLTQRRLNPGLSAFAAGILDTIGGGLQIAHASQDASKWKAEEYDTLGKYSAEYQRGSELGVITKRKLKYESTLVGGQSGSDFHSRIGFPEILASQGEIRMKNGVPAEVALDEKIKMSMLSSAPLVSSTSLKLTLVQRKPAVPSVWSALRAQTRVFSMGTLYAEPKAVAASLDAAKIGGRSFEAVIGELEGLEKEPESKKLWSAKNGEQVSGGEIKKREGWFRRNAGMSTALAAIFRQQPDTISKAAGMVIGGSAASNSIIAALGSAGTEAAQGALFEITTDKSLSNEIRNAAALSLIRANGPSVAIARKLETLLGDPQLGMYAIYGLGTYARKLREAGEISESDRLGRLLTARLASSAGDDESIHLLRGIANSGYSGALPAVRPYLRNSDWVLRSAAVDAVQLMQTPEADAIIAERLDEKTEQEYKARLSALDAARLREPSKTLIEAVTTVAQKDTSGQVREKAVKLLESWADKHPELRKVLQQLGKTISKVQDGLGPAKAERYLAARYTRDRGVHAI